MNRFVVMGGSALLRSSLINPGKFNSLNKSFHFGNQILRTGFTPSYVAVEKGKTVYWCACGHSVKQPLCDGSHKTKGEGKTPIAFIAPEATSYLMCTCKKTKKKPMCDGSQDGCRSFH